MTNLFYIVRHAIKEKLIGDVDITTQGIKEAHKTADYFQQLNINQIYSSPLQRAKHTASIISNCIYIPVLEDARLRERANWGDIPDQTFDEFVALWDKCTQERDYVPPQGDSARMAGDRLALCLSDISLKYPENHTVIMTHGGFITDFLINVISESELDQVHPNFINVQTSLVKECSITIISFQDGHFKLIDFANTSHL